MKDYDVRSIFEMMELELIASMKRNLSKHQNWESKEKMNWTMWQVEQLKTLEQFKKENEKIFSKKFTNVNNEIAKFLQENYKTAGIEQEKAILEQLSKGYTIKGIEGKGLESGFFTLNKDKMNALINSVTHDMKKAEHAMLRLVNDQYRKTIFRAEVMSNSGAFTLKQSIDKATADFLKAGINCVEYKNGRRVNIATYAEMAIRTANKRAILVSEGDVRKAYGVHTVRISKYGACSETCLPWQGRVYVDNVYSGGTKEEATKLKLPLLSEAIDGGLFHPNCRHRATTYFPGISKPPKDEGAEEIPLKEQQERKQHILDHRKERMAISEDKKVERYDSRKSENFEEFEKKLLNVSSTLNSLDYMGKPYIFSNDVISIKGYEVKSSNGVYVQTYSEDSKKTVAYMERAKEKITKLNEVDRIMVAKDLHGLAAYDHEHNWLFVNEKVMNEDYITKQLGTGYFVAENVFEILQHEMFHKKHWDYIRTKEKKYGIMKSEVEANLRKYVATQQHYQPSYLKQIVSENALDGFYYDESLNELIAEVLLQSEKSSVKDEVLLKLVKECVCDEDAI